MKISVALCSYNGAAYIEEQLASIASQDRPPDELIVCDDASVDDTTQILGRFAAETGFPVHTHVNARNLGSTKNFEKAVKLCNGDIIVLADQDDVWCPSKLSVIEDRMDRNPEASFVFTNAEMVDHDLTPLGYHLWDAVHFTVHQRQLFEQGLAPAVLVRYNIVTGSTMAFRSEYRDYVLPIPDRWVHDGWIALVLSMLAPCVLVDQALIQYRQHGKQQIGEEKYTLLQKLQIARKQDQSALRSVADDYELALERLKRFAAKMPDQRWIVALAEKVRHYRNRATMRDRPWRLPLILRELLRHRYSRYSLGWKSLAQDILL